ncbi:TetR/AcrR family transcriptional regulator [Rummeliibacillus sp. POC4]|uniref:TetR/AcrR family transcriptional regulator n=1 Tax=Rummeliibacillus sp. POC4 TaxID=2305899 RepID=UPI000E65F65A|nr:TetR/AcrR family transcriptional regulator [Rummeliibacillus sp. POC4]RIJ63094.1 TetR/AcrR family transcriptional regulator [Rummeliibacillus sp. POC4]
MGRDRKFSTIDLFIATKKQILQVGYDGFTISHLAETLEVSRAAIYKQYINKDELLIDFMLYEMDKSVGDLKQVRREGTFEQQLEDLLNRMAHFNELHQILGMVSLIQDVSEEIIRKKAKLSSMHKDLYEPLLRIVTNGKREKNIDPSIPDSLVLGFIFQTIDIPKQPNLSTEEQLQYIKQLILHGVCGENK